MDVNNRIRQFLKKMKITIQTFESSIGKTNGYIAHTKSPTAGVLADIAKVYPNLNLDWLITGKGDMIKNSGVNIGDNNKVGDVANSASHINKNTINVTLPESGDQKIIDPDGRVEISKVDSSNKELESLTREYELLKIRYSHLEDSMKMKDDLIASQRETIELLRYKP